MRYRLLTAVAPLALAATFAACNGSPAAPDMKWADPTKISYYPGLHVDLSRMTTTANGTFYWDSVPGTGTEGAQQGDHVSVRYNLWLPDGTLIQSLGTSTPFLLTPDSVIGGWVQGLTGAVQGTTRQLVIPPAAAYGANGTIDGRIPPYATIIYLVSVDKITHVSPGSDVVTVSATPAEVPELTRAVATALARSARASP